MFITRNATIPTLEELAIVPLVCKYWLPKKTSLGRISLGEG